MVELHYGALYQFALSLSRDEADACDLTQQTFYVWATKGHQLRDRTKVKTWLFTTLHRLFLETRRKSSTFRHSDLDSVEAELPTVSIPADQLDAAAVLQALARVDEVFQAPVALYYLQDCAYGEIAEILGVPLGTVKSRIARGVTQLKRMLTEDVSPEPHGEGGAP